MHKECATGQETLESLSLAIEAHTVPTVLANQCIIVSNKIPLLHHSIQARKVREVKVAQIWDSLQQQFLGYESAPKQSRVIFVTVRWGHVCGSFQGSGPSTWPGIEKFLHLRLRMIKGWQNRSTESQAEISCQTEILPPVLQGFHLWWCSWFGFG